MKKLKKIIIILILYLIFNISLFISNIQAATGDKITNTTKAYFCAEVTKGYGNGDCILLENYDSNGNKIYGLIDAGRKKEKQDKDGNESTAVKEYLKNHGVTKLEFMLITHQHSDHHGDALTVLNNFDVKTLYMKQADKTFVKGGLGQGTYENMIKTAISKGIKVVGVSYQSLIDPIISPGRSQDFINNTKNAKKDLFISFNNNNTKFKFGSSTIQIINWEIFDKDGNQFITGVTNNTVRETVNGENNNSVGVLLTQGNKKAFFSGDINNSDKNTETGRIGDEDRIKDIIGDIDLLKVGHHGYSGSNTTEYMNTIKPEYAIITNDKGKICAAMNEWLNNNNTDYLYTTNDETGVIATIENNKIYFGLETGGTVTQINGRLYYIPEDIKNINEDYRKNAYEIQYKDTNANAKSWKELKKLVDNNKKEKITLDNTNKKCTITRLNINLNIGGDWTANESISIDKNQNITLTANDNIKILRGTSLNKKPLITSQGIISLGKKNMQGKITIDGNKSKVEASNTLLKSSSGIINIYNNVILCNNMNKISSKVNSGTTIEYIAFGSAIFASNTIVNMYGGEISNNSQEIVTQLTLPQEIGKNQYCLETQGAGIYLSNESIFNMYGGTIQKNIATNNSKVLSNEEYTNSQTSYGKIYQEVFGTGVYAKYFTQVNLLGGSIKNNSGTNNSQLLLSTPKNTSKETNIKLSSSNVNGVALYAKNSIVQISNGFEISNNNATNNAKTELQKNTKIVDTSSIAINGATMFLDSSNCNINSAIITGGKNTTKKTAINNGKIGSTGTSNISTNDYGGIIHLRNNSKTTIKNLSLKNGNSATQGGGIYLYNIKCSIQNSEISNCQANYGGGIYAVDTSSMLELNNVIIKNNKAISGSGGGIYAYGNLIINGENTKILNNTADTYGGGIMVKNDATLNNGLISGNKANKNAGGGIRTDGTLIVNGGKIQENSAKTTGGGIDFSGKNSKLYLNNGIVKSNTANNKTQNIYPNEEQYTKDTKEPTLQVENISNKLTNKNIILTIKASDDETGIKSVTVNNKNATKNGNVYNYTITANGTYTIKATDNAENSTSKEIKITNIDKTGPVITGPKYSATDLKNEVILVTIKTNEEVQEVAGWNLLSDKKTLTKSYTKNVTEEVIVKDLLGNETKVKVVVNTIETEVVFELKKYKKEGNQIKNIQPNEDYAGFSQNITTNKNYTIKEGNKNVTGTDKIKTGQVLTVGEEKYTLVVTGDTNGDGTSDIKDMLQMNRHRVNKAKLSGCYFEAGDVNKDKKIDIKDILRINVYRLNKIINL